MKIYLCCVLEPENGDESVELDVYDFKSPGVALAMYNVDEVCLPASFSCLLVLVFASFPKSL